MEPKKIILFAAVVLFTAIPSSQANTPPRLGACKTHLDCGTYGYSCIEELCEPTGRGKRPECRLHGPRDRKKSCGNATLTCLADYCTENLGIQRLCQEDYHCDWNQFCQHGRCELGVERERPFCFFNEDCPEDHFCIEGGCQKRPWWQKFQCKSSTDCPEKKVCWNSKCYHRTSLLDWVSLTHLCDGETSVCDEGRSCQEGLCYYEEFKARFCSEEIPCPPPFTSCKRVENETRFMKPDEPLSICVKENSRFFTFCHADSDCFIGEVCFYGFCLDFGTLYLSKRCSHDGHCGDKSCIKGHCDLPVRKKCTRKSHSGENRGTGCPDFHFCSFGHCVYPQRRLRPGEPLPCLSQSHCPEGRLCYQNACVTRNLIPRGSCAVVENCYDREVTDEYRCYEGHCLEKHYLPDFDGLRVIQPRRPVDEASGLGLPSRGAACSSDLSCRPREICVQNRCIDRGYLNPCTSLRGCNREQHVCFYGRCLFPLDYYVESPAYISPVTTTTASTTVSSDPENPNPTRRHIFMECVNDHSCSSGRKCVNFTCTKNTHKKQCSSDFECPENQQCHMNYCITNPSVPH